MCLCVCVPACEEQHLGLSGGGLDGSHGAAAASLLQHHYHGPSPSSAQSVAALEAVVEAADQLKRVAPLFRRDRPSDEVVSGRPTHRPTN